MAWKKHSEKHFTASETVRDIVIGMSDGLTVPFALAAGLSGAVNSSSLVVTAGLAEIAAGSIAMGLGGYMAAKGDAEHYERELKRECREVAEIPHEEQNEVRLVFRDYGLNDEEINPIIQALTKRPHDWVKFMMRFELGMEKPESGRATTSAITIASAYAVGGSIPLLPYMFISNPGQALWWSIGATLCALFLFGWIKGSITGTRASRSALETVMVGGLAAAAAFSIAKVVSQKL